VGKLRAVRLMFAFVHLVSTLASAQPVPTPVY